MGWQKRLQTIVHHPRRGEVTRFIREVAQPALEEVAAELRNEGHVARVARDEDEDGRVWMEVLHGDEIDFFYSVHPRAYEPPSFVMRDTRGDRAAKLKYFRAEVHLREGGQDYDIMGWTSADIIGDVLDQYERHLHFLHAMR